jgi:gliding motility-associated-like protein
LKVTGTGNLKYVWLDSQGVQIGQNIDIDQLPEGTYKLQVYDESTCGMVESAAFIINTANKLQLDDKNAMSLPTTCNSSTGSIKGITQTGATTFKWLDENNTVVGTAIELTGVPAGTYRLIIGNSLNCTQESKAFKIDVVTTIFPTYNITTTPTTCDQFNGSINIDFSTNTPPNQIKVVDQADVIVGNTANIRNLKPGNYKIYFKNNDECESFYKEVQIGQIPMLVFSIKDLSVENDLCGQGTGRIKGIKVSGGSAPYTYRWEEGYTEASFSTLDLSNLHAGEYRLFVTDANNCTIISDPVKLLLAGLFIEPPSVDAVSACPGSSVNIRARHQQLESGTYSLFKGTSLQPISTNQTGEFTILAEPAVSYSIGYKLGLCESLPTPVNLDFNGITLRIPNTFSPNGDGVNDVWLIKDLNKYSQVTIGIFNRNGQKIYTGNGSDKPFDGFWKGAVLPVGTYYYIIDMKGTCGNLTGSVTIMK